MKKSMIVLFVLLSLTAAVYCGEMEDLTGQVQDATSLMGSKAKQDNMIAGFEPGALIAGIAFATFGLYAFGRGKKRQNVPLMLIGVALLAFPYFVRETLWTIVIGGLLCVGFYFRRN